MSAQPSYRWPVPPPGGFTADSLDCLPDLPPHTELIDGSLVFVSPQKLFHMRAIDLLTSSLRKQAPHDLRARREMTVTINQHQRPEPDVLVVKAASESDPDLTTYPPEAVVLAVEVVSPDSELRDRKRKPQLYAEAGIRHFWLVDNTGDGKMAVYVYELDPVARGYTPTGIYHDSLKLNAPFDIEIDLTEIDRL